MVVWICLLLLTQCIIIEAYELNQTNTSKPLGPLKVIDRHWGDLVQALADANNGNTWTTFRQSFNLHEAVRQDLQTFNTGGGGINWGSLAGSVAGAITSLLPGGGIAGALVGWVVSTVFGTHDTLNDRLGTLVTAMLNHIESFVDTSITNRLLDNRRSDIEGILNVLRLDGVTSGLARDMARLAPRFFDACWGNNAGCQAWQRAGSLFLSLHFSFLHVSILTELGRQALENGDRAEVNDYLATMGTITADYIPLLVDSFNEFQSFRIDSVQPPEFGVGARQTVEVTTPPRDNFVGAEILCYSGGQPMIRSISVPNTAAGQEIGRRFMHGWLNCWNDYANDLIVVIDAIRDEVALFQQLRNPARRVSPNAPADPCYNPIPNDYPLDCPTIPPIDPAVFLDLGPPEPESLPLVEA